MTQIREIYIIWGLDQILFKQYIITCQYADPLNLRNVFKKWLGIRQKDGTSNIKNASAKSKMQKDVKIPKNIEIR